MENVETTLSSAVFEHKDAWREGRVIIESRCRRCGASALVSHADGSLEQWEREHICLPELPDVA